jgi:hypothetical protein
MKKAVYRLLLSLMMLFAVCQVQAAHPDLLVGAYYYPWHTGSSFHGGSPPGSTTLVYHLDPQQTPELGWYDQNEETVISQHYQWANYAGLDFFVCSYWGMGKKEDTVIRSRMLDNPDRGDIKLAVFLETSITPRNPDVTAASITAEIDYLCDYYFNQDGYFRIDGKPVIFIYVTRAMSDADLTWFISAIRTAAANKGIGDVYIVGDEVWGSPNISAKTPRVSQMDAITNYDVYGNLGRARFVTDANLDAWQTNNNSWKSLADSLGKKFIPSVSPGFNDRGVREGHQPSSRKLNSDSNAFGTLFSGMLDRVTEDMDMVMVTSWNEWHEDTQIEPVAVAAPTNLDDGAENGYYSGYYTDGLYYNGYGTLYLDILREQTCASGDPNCPGCGDAVCASNEDRCNCPGDCGPAPAAETLCNDGIDEDCDGNADCADADCSSDPACLCGNGICDPGEDCHTCSEDCISKTGGKPSTRYCCGDEICESAEDSINCAVDCGAPAICTDGACDPNEDQCSCPADCGPPAATETNCTDGIDEDCDNYTDCDDADCIGNSVCDCLQKRAACSSDSECCSNKCRGGTCK